MPKVLVPALFLLPVFLDLVFYSGELTATLRPIVIFAVLAMGLHIVLGLTGLLHLGLAGMMAIGTYSYAILTCDIYPFQLGFLSAAILTSALGFLVGAALGLPVLRLRGDYLAIVTLAFGEIIQDLLKNLEVITKGMQGINPIGPYYSPSSLEHKGLLTKHPTPTLAPLRSP